MPTAGKFSKVGRFAEAVALIVKQPRTVPELGEALDASSKDLPRRYIRVLRAEGLVYISEWRVRSGVPTAVYSWQPSVCYFSDASRPLGARNVVLHESSDTRSNSGQQ